MMYVCATAINALAAIVVCAGVVAPANADVTGGVRAPATVAGESGHGVETPPPVERPVVSELSVPSTVTAGRPPRVVLRINEQGVATIAAQVTVTALESHKRVLMVSMGWIHTARAVAVSWPKDAALKPGGYQVSVSAHDHRGRTLERAAHSSGKASLTVTVPPTPMPLPPKLVAPTSIPTTPGVPTPAQTVAAGAVFPVQGEHNFGGPENVFGAPRDGYLHQGQDILTAEGTPVVAPLAGTILTTSYQAEGAGYYAVEQTGVGFDFMFAHCEASSLAVSSGQAVTPGQTLCKAGQTGDATAPHLDFEIWVGGWQAKGGEPINPLPYLEAWEGS
jgi:biotin carboxyl carrier protein